MRLPVASSGVMSCITSCLPAPNAQNPTCLSRCSTAVRFFIVWDVMDSAPALDAPAVSHLLLKSMWGNAEADLMIHGSESVLITPSVKTSAKLVSLKSAPVPCLRLLMCRHTAPAAAPGFEAVLPAGDGRAPEGSGARRSDGQPARVWGSSYGGIPPSAPAPLGLRWTGIYGCVRPAGRVPRNRRFSSPAAAHSCPIRDAGHSGPRCRHSPGAKW